MSTAMVAVQTVRVWRHRDAAGLSLTSWVASIICCMLWGVYGFRVESAPQIVANVLAVALSALIVGGILLFEKRWGNWRTTLLVSVGVAATLGFTLAIPADTVGTLAVASSLIMNFPQVFLSIANLVRKRPTSGISLTSFTIGIISNSMWVGYSLLNNDMPVLVACLINIATYATIAVCTILTRRFVTDNPPRKQSSAKPLT